MVENRHGKSPFDDGGATLALRSRDTSPAVQLIQSAIESQRTTYPYDGSDLSSAAAVGPPSWMHIPPLPLPPPPRPLALDDAPVKSARVDGSIVPYVHPPGPSRANRQLGVRSKAVKTATSYDPTPGAGGTRYKRNTSGGGVASTTATDRKRYKKSGKVPGRTAEEKLDYLLQQQASQPKARQQPADGMLQLPPSDGTNPFANVFRLGN